ncbi:hypothetical protein CR492_01135 [Methylocella silvestris]|uniref:Uncharacterized protein n=1 Tax=Methylocella silvestris TaxID=199596 RepID=A0A2J7TLB1_METSI|nr:hypothetical protein CR492_01135 [Methylocella silvestris]
MEDPRGALMIGDGQTGLAAGAQRRRVGVDLQIFNAETGPEASGATRGISPPVPSPWLSSLPE